MSDQAKRVGLRLGDTLRIEQLDTIKQLAISARADAFTGGSGGMSRSSAVVAIGLVLVACGAGVLGAWWLRRNSTLSVRNL